MTAKEMQGRSAAKRWAGLTPEERSAKMREVRQNGLKKRTKKKARASSANVRLIDGEGGASQP